MRRVSIEKVQSGMRLAKSIYSEDGQVLLGTGVELKETYIERLRNFNISEIYIEDELSKDIDVKDVINDRTRQEAKTLIRNIMEECKNTSQFTSDKVKGMVNHIIDELLANKDILINLSDLKTVDDYTFAHSVNVCVLSLITGIKLGLNQLRLRDLGVGALLHDIGKIVIPENILKKPARLDDNEFNVIKTHTTLGYDIVKNNPNISASSAYIVLAHHERYDGSGYPLCIKGDNIHLFARIVAIADVYDALTSDRVYRKKVKVHEVIEYITTLGEHHFDKTIVECFLENIAVYPVGTGVILSTGEKGIIVDVNKRFPARPIVRVVCNPDGSRKNAFEEIDLTKTLNIMIRDTCEI
ncbi:HD-GYP domain-containing protein [Petroclostridium sp. X23]|uniref:HD-GYP domain-containing protein n=1 Tax=Petroclostridium sp. X23 TaxID=3045146 RepID=UPI0024AD4D61|nr:HD-GYP domain-containing protein [Petroclostridium sp. X23]WHH60471.1 HD-GYP domain-containing protein [Petroclostridium sp. X23]